MKAKYLVLLLGLCIGCGNGGGGSSTSTSIIPKEAPAKTISVVNDSPAIVQNGFVFDPTRISDMIPIWQSQLNEVAKAWGGNYKCNIHEGGTGDYQMIFTTTNSVSGCGPACHTVSDNGQPVGLVNPSEGIASGNDPLLEAAHEIDELCVDPTVDHTIENKLVEIVDPVVCWTYCEGQEIVPGKPEQDCTGDNRVPDFVFPSYYDPNGKPPYDFMNLLTKPGSHC